METNGPAINDVESGNVRRISSYGNLEHSEHKTMNSQPNGLCMNMVQSAQNELKSTNEGDLYPIHPAHNEHLKRTRQYYRDMMLGVNDGLVSTLLLVAGVVGGGMGVKVVLLTAVSGAIAGAISMFAGEFVATKSQNEVMSGVSIALLTHIYILC